MRNLFFFFALLATGLLSSCVSDVRYSLDKQSVFERAACVSQAYLGKNGFFSPLAEQARDDVQLEPWDEQKVQSGKDRDEIIQSRAGTFSGRLWGVVENDADYSVFYQFEGSKYRCVFVSADFTTQYLPHQFCKRRRNIFRLSEDALTCNIAK